MKLILILVFVLPLLLSLPHDKKRKKNPPSLSPLIQRLKKLCGPDLSLCEIKKKADLERTEKEEEGERREEGVREGGRKEDGEGREGGGKQVGRFMMRRPSEKERSNELNDVINKSFVMDEGFV